MDRHQGRELNDDGQDADIRSIEKKVKRIRNEVITDGKNFKKMTKQIDSYWGKLFTDPITVTSSAGEVTIAKHDRHQPLITLMVFTVSAVFKRRIFFRYVEGVCKFQRKI